MYTHIYAMYTYLIKGSSSLLLIISAVRSIYTSKFIVWKFANCLIVPASFLCNATDYKYEFMVFDYLAIFLLTISYINNIWFYKVMLLSLMSEYKLTNSIETTKNIAFAASIVQSNINTYYMLDKIYIYFLLSSSIVGVAVYKIRYDLINKHNMKYNLLLTYLFHICVMNVMYVSSYTA
jgi:hypothetical protein